MAEMKIHWKVERMDGGEIADPRFAECVLQIEGWIEYDGQPAGLVDAHYVYSDDPESGNAFRELWDVDARTCSVYEEIMDPDWDIFLDPLQHYLDPASGILCVHFIALRPPFRGIGLGLRAMRELVRSMSDPRIGLVLLDAQPLQHMAHGYDDFDEEVRELPWNSKAEDLNRLIRHFSTWGMEHLKGTRYLFASPDALRDSRTPQWPPCVIHHRWNTCHVCGEWVDLDAGEGKADELGAVHFECEG
jgi:hypothetical protein